MPLVGLTFIFIQEAQFFTSIYFCNCGVVFVALLSFCVISFSTFGPVSLWAGLSSLDRKNTILSGKCKRTGGDSGSLGDLQAHHPRPLAAHTPFSPPPNTNKSMGTPNTHTHNPLPHSTDSISTLW